MAPFDGKFQNLWNDIKHLFAQAFTIFDILAFQMFELENIGQGRRVQHSKWCYSMTDINLYKSQHAGLR